MPATRRKLPKRLCPFCQKMFTPNTRKQKYHNAACRSADWRWRKAEEKEQAIKDGLDALSLDIDDLLEAV